MVQSITKNYDVINLIIPYIDKYCWNPWCKLVITTCWLNNLDLASCLSIKGELKAAWMNMNFFNLFLFLEFVITRMPLWKRQIASLKYHIWVFYKYFVALFVHCPKPKSACPKLSQQCWRALSRSNDLQPPFCSLGVWMGRRSSSISVLVIFRYDTKLWT